MRKYIYSIFLALCASLLFIVPVYAGVWSPSANNANNITYSSGFVGVGAFATSPTDDLYVRGADAKGTLMVGDGRYGSWTIQGQSTTDAKGTNNISTNAYVDATGWHKRWPGYESWIMSNYNTSDLNGGYFKIFHISKDSSTPTTFFSINGTGTTFVMALTVNTAAWGDDVFESDYKLLPLSEVESYIKANGHLPNIPSAEEVIKNGINVGDMQKLHMQKIEELTLHSIEQEKKINNLEARLTKLEGLIVN